MSKANREGERKRERESERERERERERDGVLAKVHDVEQVRTTNETR